MLRERVDSRASPTEGSLRVSEIKTFSRLSVILNVNNCFNKKVMNSLKLNLQKPHNQIYSFCRSNM